MIPVEGYCSSLKRKHANGHETSVPVLNRLILIGSLLDRAYRSGAAGARGLERDIALYQIVENAAAFALGEATQAVGSSW